MNLVQLQEQNCYILYDQELTGQVDSAWFTPEYWQAQLSVVGQAQGRGTTWFVQHQEQHWVLRHFHRGGLMATLLGDRYWWAGLANTRAWREWHLLAQLHAAGLPVPAPVAARVCRHGLFYTAQLITAYLPQVRSLAAALRAGALGSKQWQQIGKTLKQLHQHGVYHADLNAHNILIGEHGQVYVIDFDRGAIRAGHTWRKANLWRLKRSLHKLASQYSPFYFSELDFATLREAYYHA